MGAFSLLDIRFLDEKGGGDAGSSKRYFTRHFFAKIRTEPDTVHFATMGSNWLKERIAATGKPAHEGGGDNLVLTAPSAELRKALLPYLDHPEAFEDEDEFRRVK